MTPAWALRQEELLSDCVVSPHVFDHMVDRLCDFVVPYQHALATVVHSMSCFCSKTPYKHHLFSMSCEIAMTSEHYLDITTVARTHDLAPPGMG